MPSSACQTSADRKSTRLNSSHGSISYAVFCLKKKRNTQPNRPTRSLHILRLSTALRPHRVTAIATDTDVDLITELNVPAGKRPTGRLGAFLEGCGEAREVPSFPTRRSTE